MPFEKGKPRHPNAGRKKGTPNKDSLPLEQKAAELGVDPFTILLHFAGGHWEQLGYKEKCTTKWTGSGIEYEEDVITPAMRLTASKEAAQYLYPKKKAIELSNDDTQGFKIIVEDYSKK